LQFIFSDSYICLIFKKRMGKRSKIVFVQFARIFMAMYTLILGSGCSQPLLEKLMLARQHSTDAITVHQRIAKIKLGPEVLEAESGVLEGDDFDADENAESLEEVELQYITILHDQLAKFFQVLLESHNVAKIAVYQHAKSILGLPPLYDIYCSWKLYDVA
jgi:hypothetical protein